MSQTDDEDEKCLDAGRRRAALGAVVTPSVYILYIVVDCSASESFSDTLYARLAFQGRRHLRELLKPRRRRGVRARDKGELYTRGMMENGYNGDVDAAHRRGGAREIEFENVYIPRKSAIFSFTWPIIRRALDSRARRRAKRENYGIPCGNS